MKPLSSIPLALPPHFFRRSRQLWLSLVFLSALFVLPRSHAADHGAPTAHGTVVEQKQAASAATAASEATPLVDLKAALREQLVGKKRLTLVISDKPETKPETKPATTTHAAATKAATPSTEHAVASEHAPVVNAPAVTGRSTPKHEAPAASPRASRDYIRAKAAAMVGHELPAAEGHGGDAHEGEVHWAYEGANGPQNWGKLKPEFNACAIGKRQSPINIEESATLQGPAEPLQFNYTPSSGTVVNNGHSIQVDLYGDNSLTVRGTVYKLVQFHFHTPSEEQVNYRNYAMVAHLVHKSQDGRLAVVAVLLDPGVANGLIDKVWTYMPLDVNDRVRMPTGIIDMNELLPKDQRYFQFIGSLTTPPCTEGVLWMVLKQPTPLSSQQIHLFQQLFPSNARPVQPVNGRAVREAM